MSSSETHPPSSAMCTARQLHQQYARLVRVPTLARAWHHARRARTRIQASIRYVDSPVSTDPPGVEALGRVRDEKVEALALSVGYRSAKNFYRAFRQLTGMTPTGFRRLFTERAAALVAFAKLAFA